MSTLSYLNYADIGAFEGLYQQYKQASDSVDRGGAILLKGLNFQRLIFLKGTKKAGCPRLPRLLLKTLRYLCWMQQGNDFFTCS